MTKKESPGLLDAHGRPVVGAEPVVSQPPTITLVVPVSANAAEKEQLLREVGLRGMALVMAKDELGVPLSAREKSALDHTPTGTRDNARALARTKLARVVAGR